MDVRRKRMERAKLAPCASGGNALNDRGGIIFQARPKFPDTLFRAGSDQPAPSRKETRMIPLGDASRRPVRMPVVTLAIIVVNVLVFLLELAGGDAFINQWAFVPADLSAGRNLITIFTAMFMHAGWLHIGGNMLFLWVF